MPFRPRRTRKPRKSMRKTRRRAAPIRNLYRYKRYVQDTVLINQPGVGLDWEGKPGTNWKLGTIAPDDNGLYQVGGQMTFQLDDVIQYTEFVQLYDRYKIDKVELTIMPLVNTSYTAQQTSGNQQSGTLPTMYYAVDYDDDSIPSSSIAVLQKSDAKVKRLADPFKITIRPKIATVVNAEGGNVVAGVSKPMFLNCTEDEVNFRGLKFYIRDLNLPDGAAKLNNLIRVQARYTLSFKDPQ